MLPLLFILAPAHAYQQSVEPKFFYRTGTAAVPAEDTVQQEWADEQAYMNRTTTSPQGTWVVTVSNLHPYTSGGHGYTLNGTWDQQSYDLSQCGYFPNGQVSCSNFPDWDYIQTYYACPAGFGPSEHIDSPTSHTLSCQKAQPDVQPPPKCNSCIGNPVYASTGQKIQVETDYTGLPGLTFERTYRSNVGFFASSTSTAFIDNSLPDGSTTYNCLPGYYVHPWTQVQTPYCFRYITLAQPNYQLATNDGRYLQFSGSNTAVTQNADINERVTQVTNSSGAIEWHVKREDDSTEIYNAKGVLTQTVLRNGQVVTYTYSDANTPASVAPRPGLLLTKTDAFGHTLSWLYDSLGHVAQMTDPAGGVYQYSYDTVGNLAAVTYPDSSGKSYLYNESAYTGGTNLPQALTGITDESGARFATFKYDSIGRGTSTEHAGGVEKYTLSYQSSSPGATATVIGPLGATRTYRFQSILSYARDSSQTQPAPSGSGTVSTAYTYDANGNVASTTDFVGNRNCYLYDLTRNLETVRVEGLAPAISCPTNLATYAPTAGTRQRKISTTWNATYRLPALITEANRTTAFTYDTTGNLLTRTVTDTAAAPNVSRTWTYTYDSYGRVLTADGPRADVSDLTTYTYFTCATGYECGQVQTVTNAAGQITTYNTYNAHGQPLTITDPNGIVTTLTYDARQRLTSRHVGTETTTFTYWPTGLLKQVTLPDASYLLYTYDAAHRLTQISDGLGNAIDYTLDAMGNRTAENSYDPSNTLHQTHTRVFNGKRVGTAHG